MTTPPPPSAKVLCCPFCDAAQGYLRSFDEGCSFNVTCVKCRASTMYYGTADEAIAAWNRRSQPQPEAQAVPGEWVTVPREPTPEMVDAGSKSIPIEGRPYDQAADWDGEAYDTYRAMLAAAPIYPAASAGAVACDVRPTSSRVCERGTKSCEVRHAQPPADLVGVLAEAAADFLEVIAQEGEHGADHYDDDCAICRSWKRLHDASLPARAPEDKA